jgi:hypothetical protein
MRAAGVDQCVRDPMHWRESLRMRIDGVAIGGKTFTPPPVAILDHRTIRVPVGLLRYRRANVAGHISRA